MEYHDFCSIQSDLNNLIDRLEDNQKVFSDRLAILERDYPHFYYQDRLYRLRNAIASLKQIRDAIGAMDWV